MFCLRDPLRESAVHPKLVLTQMILQSDDIETRGPKILHTNNAKQSKPPTSLGHVASSFTEKGQILLPQC